MQHKNLMKLYKIITILLFPAVIIYMIIRLIKGKENLKSSLQKFTIQQNKLPNKQIIWFHAASVGEMNIAVPLIKNIFNDKKDLHCLVTTTTLTSSKIFNSIKIKNTTHQFLPLDISFIINRFLNHWKPIIAIFIESELWPNIINHTAKNIPILLFNARLSDISYKKWKKYKKFTTTMLEKFSHIFAASKLDYNRFSIFTKNNIEFIDHFKYSSPILDYSDKYVNLLKKNLKNNNIFVAASTHKGEEKIIFAAHKKLKKQISNLFTIIIPRHPNRIDEVKRASQYCKLEYITDINDFKAKTELFLVSGFSILGNFFQIAEIVFIGGSLVNIGGHNIIEPAQQNNAIIVGPYTSNFKEIIEEFNKEKAICIVKTTDELKNQLLKLFQNSNYKNLLIANSQNLLKKHFNVLKNITKIIYNYIEK